MAKKESEPSFWTDAQITAAQDEGRRIRENPRSIMPALAGWGQEPSGRDTLISALMGFGKSMQNVQQASALGDPFTAALAGIAGAGQQPGPQAVAQQRYMQMLETMPVEAVSPALIEAHPELAGLPLSVVQKIAPLIQRAQFFTAAEAGRDRRAEMTTAREEVRGERAVRSEERNLRKELKDKSTEFVTIRDNYARIQSVAKNPTPAGDLSMIFSYMKILDPGSVVRESEFKNAETAAPLLTRLGLDFDKVGAVWKGKKLTAEQRADFLAKAAEIYGSQKQLNDAARNEYRRLAEVAGGKPENVDVIGGANVATSGEIRKRLKGGKIGVWDSEGNFLRYE